MSLSESLKSAGFTDIKENENGSCDATKDGMRYTNLYPISHGTQYEVDVESISVDLRPLGDPIAASPSMSIKEFMEKTAQIANEIKPQTEISDSIINKKLQDLLRIEGISLSDILERASIGPTGKGICINPDCNYITDVEPDQENGYCERCKGQTVVSCLVLYFWCD